MAGPFRVLNTGDDSDGSTWAKAYVTLEHALLHTAAGETIYVSHSHTQTQGATLTLTSPGTAAAPVYIICVDDAAENPDTLATGAIIITTGAYAITLTGFAYYYGISFRCGTGATVTYLYIGYSTSPVGLVFDTCDFRLLITTSTGRIFLGLAAASTLDDLSIKIINSTFQFSNASQGIVPWSGRFIIQDKIDSVMVVAGTLPTTLILTSGANAGELRFYGCDLSNLANAYNLVNVAGAGPYPISIISCKLGASVAVTTGTIPGPGGVTVDLENCDSSDTNNRFAYHRYQGYSIKNTAQLYSATYSIGMTTNASSLFTSPLESPKIGIWNTSVGGALTARIEFIHDSANQLHDDDIWMELRYLGTSGVPLGSMATNKRGWFATPATVHHDTSAVGWTEDLANENKQSLHVHFTPQEAGYVEARVCLAKVSYTVYVDPKITIS